VAEKIATCAFYIKELKESNSIIANELENLKTKHKNLTDSHLDLEKQHNILKLTNEVLTQKKTELN